MRAVLALAALLLATPASAGTLDRLRSLVTDALQEQADDWRLVGAYDASALLAQDHREPEYVWVPPAGMVAYCGPERRPYGLGVFEAEAVANGLTPTLALVLEQTGDSRQAVSFEDVRVALGRDKPEILLQPMVQPRRLRVRIDGQGDEARRYSQLVRTQLAIEACMEHRLGRAWTGGATHLLREAFLLDPPGSGTGQQGADRMFFGGQGAPVPPMLGPPEACLEQSDLLTPSRPRERVVAGRTLVPSDVWDADLRPCPPAVPATEATRAPKSMLPLTMSSLGATTPAWADVAWRDLDLTVVGDADPARVRLQASLDGETFIDQGLFDDPDRAAPLRAGGGGLVDVLARLPRLYPQVGPPEDPRRYTVLLIPNWQIVQALEVLTPKNDDAGTLPHGVASILDHPELLFVQTRPAEPSARWPDLSVAMGPGPGRLRMWGHVTGAGQAPTMLPGERPVPARIQQAARRSRAQASVLASLGVLLVVLLAGLRRLPELWRAQPEVPVDYWPGDAVEKDDAAGLDQAAETAIRMGGP